MLHKASSRWLPLARIRALEEALAARDAVLGAQREALRSLAHDLRNPLNSILLMAQLLGETGGTPDTDRISGRIQRQCEEMIRLLNRGLD